ncbi:MAG TPA: prolyl oligopeptidase family serine peptidase, partial [Micromonosporaceae bacterium]
RIGLAGESAGGHLALMGGLEIPDIRAVAALYPSTEPLVLDPLPAEMPNVFGGDPELARAASPVLLVNSSAPPCLLVHGDADKLLPSAQSERMHELLLAAGVSSTLRIVPGADHCFVGYPDIAGLLNDMATWLASWLSAQPPRL